MADVKGITIEFRGDTTKLSKAINDVRKETRELDKELGYIDKSLQFNPGNLDLIKQKMTVLDKAAKDSEKNVADLKDALQQMKDNDVDETSAEYRELQRQIITAESKQKAYNTELNKLKAAQSTLGQLSTKFGEFGKKAEAAGQALMPVSKAAAGIDLALAGIAVAGGKAADDLNTLSKQTGVSTTDLQKYKAAADLVDVSVETMANSQVKLKKSMYQATQGSKKQTAAFDKLGISVTDSNGELRDQGEVFDEVITALGSMENETERDALAMQIFGGNAKELNSLIKDGGETYKKVADIYANNDLAIVDQDTLDKANQFQDSLDTIKLTAQAALGTVGTQLAGYLAPAIDKVASAVSKLMGWISQIDPEVLTIIGVIAGVVAGLAPLLILIGKVSTGISAIMGLMSTLGLSFTAIAGPIGIAIAAITAIIAIGVLLYKNWDTIKQKVTEVVAHVKAKWIMFKRDVTSVFNSVKTFITTTWTNIKTAVTTTVTALVNAIKLSWTAFKVGLTVVIDAIKKKVVDTWNAIKTTVTTTVTNLVTSIKDKWDALKTAIATKIDAIKTSIATKWDTIKESVKTKVESIKESVKTKFDSMKESVKSKVDAIKDAVTTKFDAIKQKIIDPIEKAKDKVKEILDKIKSIFSNLNLQLPKFKLPHIKVDGGKAPWGIGGAGKAPSFDIQWYKRGGIFDSPTIIGVGEAGAEAVLPIEKLKDWMQPSGIVINVYAPEGMNVNELAAAVERKLVNSVKRKQYAWG